MRIHIFWYQWKATGRRPQYQAWKRTGHTERRSLEGNWKHSIWFQQHWGTSPGKDFLPGNCVSNLTIASGSCWQWVLFVFIFLVCTVFLLIINIIRIKIEVNWYCLCKPKRHRYIGINSGYCFIWSAMHAFLQC